MQVVLPYILTMGELEFQFSLSDSTQFDFYQHQSGEKLFSIVEHKNYSSLL